MCALGAIAISDSPSQSDYELVANFYGLDKDLMDAEQRLFLKFKQGRKGVFRETTSDVVQFLHGNELSQMVHEFMKVVSILAVIPATSCSAERSFSGLRRLKSYLRSTMGQARVSSLALINIEREYAT